MTVSERGACRLCTKRERNYVWASNRFKEKPFLFALCPGWTHTCLRLATRLGAAACSKSTSPFVFYTFPSRSLGMSMFSQRSCFTPFVCSSPQARYIGYFLRLSFNKQGLAGLKTTMTEYQFVKEWNRKSGTFSSLTPQPKRPAHLASTFDTEAEEFLDSYEGNRPVYGSMRNSPSAGDMGKGSAAEEENEQAPSRGGDREHVSSARKRKRASSSALAGVVAAFQEMSAGIMRIEKENSERAREAHEMAKDAHELEKRKFEFQQKKVEREEERADKFVGVLGQIAGAFRKMAEKM